MKNALVLLVSLLLLPAGAASQTIDGTVLQDSTRTPIADVRVEVVAGPGAPAVLSTDSTGAFRLNPRPGGTVVLRLRHPSYTTIDSVSLTVGSGERLEVEFRMGSSPILLAPLIVRARADEGVSGFRDRLEHGGFGRFMGREEIDRRRPIRTSDLLRTMAGVRVEQRGAGISYITMRGSGTQACLPDLYIDGMRMPQMADSGIDGLLTPSTLEGVEVYTSSATAPSVFAAHGACGIVAFWTRPGPPGKWSWRKFGAGLGAFALVVLLLR